MQSAFTKPVMKEVRPTLVLGCRTLDCDYWALMVCLRAGAAIDASQETHERGGRRESSCRGRKLCSSQGYSEFLINAGCNNCK